MDALEMYRQTLAEISAALADWARMLERDSTLKKRPTAAINVKDWPARLLALERDLLQGWDVGRDLDLGSNLLVRRIRRTRLPAVRPLIQPIEQVDLPEQILAATEFPLKTYKQFRWLLWMLGGRSATDLRLHRLSLHQLRLLLLFVVQRAVALMLNRATGKRDREPAILTDRELQEHYANRDRFGWEPCLGRIRTQPVHQTWLDLLENGAHEALFREKCELHLDDGKRNRQPLFSFHMVRSRCIEIHASLHPKLRRSPSRATCSQRRST